MDDGLLGPTLMALNAISREIVNMRSALDRNPHDDLSECFDEISTAYFEIVDEILMSQEFIEAVCPLLGF